jgi:hypothetical protein
VVYTRLSLVQVRAVRETETKTEFILVFSALSFFVPPEIFEFGVIFPSEIDLSVIRLITLCPASREHIAIILPAQIERDKERQRERESERER